MRKSGWRQIRTFARRNTQRSHASAHVFGAEPLINPVNRLASVSHEAHRLRLAHVGSAQACNDRHPRAMEAQVPQSDFAKEACPFTPGLRGQLECPIAACRFETGNQRYETVVEFGGK